MTRSTEKGRYRYQPEVDFPSRHVCLVLLSGMGDVVHGLPLVNALKRDDPERRVTWIVQPEWSPLLDAHPAVDNVLHFHRRLGVEGARRLRRDLKDHQFDVVLNAGFYFKNLVPTFLARGRIKVGFDRERAGILSLLMHHRRLPARGSRHRQEIYLELAQYLGVEPRALEWRIPIAETERSVQEEFFSKLGGERVAGIVTTSAMDVKDWPPERFSAVAAELERGFGFRVLLLGGPGARESERARRVAEGARADIVWALGPDMRRLIYLIDRCDLVIAPDTGPLHLARALDKPVIGLFGHTDPRRAGPYGKYEELVVDRYNFDADGVPYSGPEEQRKHSARPGGRGARRMELIEVDDVLRKVSLACERYCITAREESSFEP